MTTATTSSPQEDTVVVPHFSHSPTPLSSSSSSSSSSSNDTNNNNNNRQHHQLKDAAWGTTWSELDKSRFYPVMLLSSIGMRLFIYPIHFAKTRVQYHGSQNVGTMKIIRDTIKAEGFFRIYRGCTTFIITGIIGAPVFLTVLEKSRAFYVEELGIGKSIASTLSAITSSLIGQLILVPSDNVVQRLMVHQHDQQQQQSKTFLSKAKIPFQTLSTIYRDRGMIRGVYRGFSISVLSYTPTSALFWTIYGATRIHFERFFRSLMMLSETTQVVRNNNTNNGTSSSTDNSNNFEYETHMPKWKKSLAHGLSTGVCAYTAGAIANAVTTPFDAIKTRAQLNNVTARDSARQLFQEQGWKGFSLGLKMRMQTGGFMFAMFLLGYEQMKIFATKKEIELP